MGYIAGDDRPATLLTGTVGSSDLRGLALIRQAWHGACHLNAMMTNTQNQMTMSSMTDKIKGNWNVMKGQLKQRYANLTDDDLTYVEGKEEELLGRLQKGLGKTKDEVNDLLGELSGKAKETV